MKAAFAAWDNRIAPVFDVARTLHLVEATDGRIVEDAEADLPTDSVAQRVLRLVELGVGELVCGAISRPLHEMVTAHGIRVTPFIAGDLPEVIQAWLRGALSETRYAMPGCCGGSQRRRGGGRGRMGGPQAAGPTGTCRCPHCGFEENHQRGVPCVERTCPKCGTALTRV